MSSVITKTYDGISISHSIMGLVISSHELLPIPKGVTPETTVNYNLNVHNTFDKKGEVLIVKTHVEISGLEEKTVFANFVSEVGFKFKNLNEWIIAFPDEKPPIPLELHTKLIETAVSTTRGLVFSYFQSTWVPDACMPDFDIESLASSLRHKSSKS